MNFRSFLCAAALLFAPLCGASLWEASAADKGPLAEAAPAAGEGAKKAPPRAVAPFDARQARAHQEAWAKALGLAVESTNSVGAKMVLIPAGEFLMGSTDDQKEAALKIAESTKAKEEAIERRVEAELPQHRVVITKPFLLGRTEVTVGQFRKFVEASKYVTEAEQYGFGDAGGTMLTDKVDAEDKGKMWQTPGYEASDDMPVSELSWNDATAYCRWLSKQENVVYRLPTEAEWAFACRAGTTTLYFFGDDPAEFGKYGTFDENSGGQARPVGQRLPNAFGLCGMHGNVQEWCSDYYGEAWYAQSPVENPSGPEKSRYRVVRGGAWNFPVTYCRSATRTYFAPSHRYANLGFRLVREL